MALIRSKSRGAFAALLTAFALSGCGEEPPPEPVFRETPQRQPQEPAAEEPEAEEETYVGDLPELRERGRLRILIAGSLREDDDPATAARRAEHALIGGLARELGMEPVVVVVARHDMLIPNLNHGVGDIVSDNLTVTEDRATQALFSAPLAQVREQIVVRSGDDSVRSLDDLDGRQIAIRRSSAFWETAHRLFKEGHRISIREVPERYSIDDLLDRVVSGEYDLTLADSNVLDAILERRNDVQVAIELEQPRIIAWAVRMESPDLLIAVNEYLARQGVSPQAEPESR